MQLLRHRLLRGPDLRIPLRLILQLRFKPRWVKDSMSLSEGLDIDRVQSILSCSAESDSFSKILCYPCSFSSRASENMGPDKSVCHEAEVAIPVQKRERG